MVRNLGIWVTRMIVRHGRGRSMRPAIGGLVVVLVGVGRRR